MQAMPEREPAAGASAQRRWRRYLPIAAIVRLTSEEARDPEDMLRRARRLDELGIDGVIASADEVPYLRGSLSDEFWIVTPGVRPSGPSGDDQRRVSTPEEAARAGSSLLVVGRPIYRADDPAAAAAAIREEVERCRVS